jgi:hypothetical protein
MITDISERGARLFIDGIEVPDQFYLLISGEKVTRQECRVVWRLGGEIGVTFAADQPNPASRDAMERLRKEARHSLQQAR